MSSLKLFLCLILTNNNQIERKAFNSFAWESQFLIVSSNQNNKFFALVFSQGNGRIYEDYYTYYYYVNMVFLSQSPIKFVFLVLKGGLRTDRMM